MKTLLGLSTWLSFCATAAFGLFSCVSMMAAVLADGTGTPTCDWWLACSFPVGLGGMFCFGVAYAILDDRKNSNEREAYFRAALESEAAK